LEKKSEKLNEKTLQEEVREALRTTSHVRAERRRRGKEIKRREGGKYTKRAR
jgi:hypothetical protein